jgi:hypothetical protein
VVDVNEEVTGKKGKKQAAAAPSEDVADPEFDADEDDNKPNDDEGEPAEGWTTYRMTKEKYVQFLGESLKSAEQYWGGKQSAPQGDAMQPSDMVVADGPDGRATDGRKDTCDGCNQFPAKCTCKQKKRTAKAKKKPTAKRPARPSAVEKAEAARDEALGSPKKRPRRAPRN